ncbi:MAG: hypothetical protein O7B99_04905 [Planctomycetota bacterium]|nr:hypothetical protein [Planctomycetota bacterium]
MIPVLLVPLLLSPVEPPLSVVQQPVLRPGTGMRDDGRESLEELLRRVRLNRAAAMRQLEAPVAALIERIEALGAGGSRAERDQIKKEILALGPDAPPILVPFVDPGLLGGETERFRARGVAEALCLMETRSITDALIRMARSGSQEARVNAMRVLGFSKDHRRASECLADIFRHANQKDMRREAVTGLARLGGKKNEAILLEALEDNDRNLLKAVLAGLTEVGSKAARSRVRELAGVPDTAARLVDEILAYYLAVADAVDANDVRTLVRLAAHDALKDIQRIRILDTLPGFDPNLDSSLKKLFQPILDSPGTDLREAAQVCLARLGDRSMERELIRRYDDMVDKNPRWATAYEQRGDIYFRLEKYTQASKDFKKAIRTSKDQVRPRGIWWHLYVSLARSYAFENKLKNAYDTLKEGSLKRSVMLELAEDPDFAALRAHSRYGKIFDF